MLDQEEDGHAIAITSCPCILVLHLLRYVHCGGRTRKIATPVQIPRQVQVPCRCSESGRLTYSPCALILHHGDSPQSGHYTSLLITDAGQGWRMNDEQLPQGMSQSEWSRARWLLRDVYLIMLSASY